jgi:hypothetical protein
LLLLPQLNGRPRCTSCTSAGLRLAARRLLGSSATSNLCCYRLLGKLLAGPSRKLGNAQLPGWQRLLSTPAATPSRLPIGQGDSQARQLPAAGRRLGAQQAQRGRHHRIDGRRHGGSAFTRAACRLLLLLLLLISMLMVKLLLLLPCLLILRQLVPWLPHCAALLAVSCRARRAVNDGLEPAQHLRRHGRRAAAGVGAVSLAEVQHQAGGQAAVLGSILRGKIYHETNCALVANENNVLEQLCPAPICR